MNIENMLEQLKNILPEDNFKIQPATAQKELLQLEREYKINTSDFIKGSTLVTIPDEVCEKWINTLDIFINFDGSIEDLNQLSQDSSLNNKPFINQTSKEKSTKEYITEISKETGWLPCLLLFINNIIDSHSFFWMEQESRIRA